MKFIDVDSAFLKGRLFLRLLDSLTRVELPHAIIDEKVVYCGQQYKEFLIEVRLEAEEDLLPNTILSVDVLVDGEHIGYRRAITKKGCSTTTFNTILRNKGGLRLMFQNPSITDTSVDSDRVKRLGSVEARFSVYHLEPGITPIKNRGIQEAFVVSSDKKVAEYKKIDERASLVVGDGRFVAPLDAYTFYKYPIIYPPICTCAMTVHYHDEVVFNLLKNRTNTTHHGSCRTSTSRYETDHEKNIVAISAPPRPLPVIIDLTNDDNETPKPLDKRSYDNKESNSDKCCRVKLE